MSILVPCYQEQENIAELTRRVSETMSKENISWEAVLVDDGSQDRTWQEIQNQSTQDSHFKGVRHASNKGMVGAWQTAVENASGDWVVTIDADMQYAPEDIPKLVEEMEGGNCDLVQGIRTTRYEPGSRIFFSVGFSSLLKFLFSMPYDDVKSGFVLYKKEVFLEILKHRKTFRFFQHWIIVAAHYLGFKIRQIPITFSSRKAGESYISFPLGFALRAFSEIPRALVYFRFKMRGNR